MYSGEEKELNNMEHEEIIKKLDENREMIDAIFKSVEKTRKYFLIIIWITVIAFVLPLIGMMFAIPNFLESYSAILSI